MVRMGHNFFLRFEQYTKNSHIATCTWNQSKATTPKDVDQSYSVKAQALNFPKNHHPWAILAPKPRGTRREQRSCSTRSTDYLRAFRLSAFFSVISAMAALAARISLRHQNHHDPLLHHTARSKIADKVLALLGAAAVVLHRCHPSSWLPPENPSSLQKKDVWWVSACTGSYFPYSWFTLPNILVQLIRHLKF